MKRARKLGENSYLSATQRRCRFKTFCALRNKPLSLEDDPMDGAATQGLRLLPLGMVFRKARGLATGVPSVPSGEGTWS